MLWKGFDFPPQPVALTFSYGGCVAYNRFSKVEYDNCDPTAKGILVKYLNKKDVFTNAKETKGVDIKGIILTGGRNKNVFYECEIKKGWTGKWPTKFETVDIPYRKNRLIKLHGTTNFFFWVIAGDLKHAWEVKAIDMPAHVKEKYTQYAGMEKFFMIPVELCRLIKL
jgi:hypothetical protein